MYALPALSSCSLGVYIHPTPVRGNPFLYMNRKKTEVSPCFSVSDMDIISKKKYLSSDTYARDVWGLSYPFFFGPDTRKKQNGLSREEKVGLDRGDSPSSNSLRTGLDCFRSFPLHSWR